MHYTMSSSANTWGLALIFVAVPLFCLISGLVALGKVWSLHRALDHAQAAPVPGAVVWLGFIPFVGPLLILLCALAVAKALHLHSNVGVRSLRALPWIAVSMLGLLALECSYNRVFSTWSIVTALASLVSAVVYWTLLESDLKRLKSTPIAPLVEPEVQ